MVVTARDTITHDDVIEEEPEDIYDADDGFDDADDYDQYEYREEKIIIPSPKVSIDENDIPIIVNNQVIIPTNLGRNSNNDKIAHFRPVSRRKSLQRLQKPEFINN